MRIVESGALLVRSVAYGESDVVATFFTETDGVLGAVVRGARRSTKRFGGALEPIHEIAVRLEDRGRELTVLKEARLTLPRLGIVSRLSSMDVAGHALRWVRHLCPARTPEPQLWRELRRLFDALEASWPEREREESELQALAGFGLRLLAEVGYGLDFERCVRCGKPCPEGRSAFIDPGGGGLVCMRCGGSRRSISASVRELALRLRAREHGPLPAPPEARRELLDVLEEAMTAHTDFDPLKRGG